MPRQRNPKPIKIVTTHVIIGGWFHRFLATTFGVKSDILYMGHHYDGYRLNGVMHIDHESLRPMTAEDRPTMKNVVVPFQRSTKC